MNDETKICENCGTEIRHGTRWIHLGNTTAFCSGFRLSMARPPKSPLDEALEADARKTAEWAEEGDSIKPADIEREKNRVLAVVSDTLKSTKLLPCNCGREVNMGGCTGCGYHPLDCSCL